MKKILLGSFALACLLPFSTFAATLEVASTADNPATPLACIGGPSVYSCPTLRDAINAANSMAAPNTINFNGINKTTDPNCAMNDGDIICKIAVNANTMLPQITSSMTIDGSIAESRTNIPGSVTNPSVKATLRPGIELSGELMPTAGPANRALLWIQSTSNVTIKGLIFTRMPGPMIFANNASYLTLQGNYFGTDGSGKAVSTWASNFTACLTNCYGTRTPTGSEIQWIGVDHVLIGGNGNNERNVFANSFNTGVTLSDVTNSGVIGNFIGTDVLGLAKAGNRNENLEIRTFTPDVRFQLGSGALPYSGIGAYSDNNRLENNIVIDSKLRANIRLLGGDYYYKSSSTATPVYVQNEVRNNSIVGNLVGWTLAGVSAPSVQSSISISNTTNYNRVGFDVVDGKVIPKPNKINTGTFYGVGPAHTFHGAIYTFTGTGVSGHTSVPSPPNQPVYTRNTAILYNKMDGTGLMPIDLIGVNALFQVQFNGDGVKLNDAGDPDVGPNNYQNFPVLDANRSFQNPALVMVEGMLNSEPNTSYLLQFYSNNTAKCLQVPGVASMPMSMGCNNPAFPWLGSQAQVFVGEIVVTTDASGNAFFRTPAKEGVPVGNIINASATRMEVVGGALLPVETSEMSQAIDVDNKGSAKAYETASGAAGGDASPQD